jgi:hypothetical protein
MRATSFLPCHPERSEALFSCHPEASGASPKDLVAPSKRVAPSTCTERHAAGAGRPNPRPLPFREGVSENPGLFFCPPEVSEAPPKDLDHSSLHGRPKSATSELKCSSSSKGSRHSRRSRFFSRADARLRMTREKSPEPYRDSDPPSLTGRAWGLGRTALCINCSAFHADRSLCGTPLPSGADALRLSPGWHLCSSPAFLRGRGRLDRLSLLVLRQVGQPGEGAASATGFYREPCDARSTLTVASRCLLAASQASRRDLLSRGKTRERRRNGVAA